MRAALEQNVSAAVPRQGSPLLGLSTSARQQAGESDVCVRGLLKVVLKEEREERGVRERSQVLLGHVPTRGQLLHSEKAVCPGRSVSDSHGWIL